MKKRLNIDWNVFLATETDAEIKWNRFKNKHRGDREL